MRIHLTNTSRCTEWPPLGAGDWRIAGTSGSSGPRKAGLIGGFAILEAASKEEAIRLGKEFMQLHIDVLGQSYEGTLEVRPMFDPSADCS
jgi:hypothetical protein